MLVVDLLHEFELGIWKGLFTHLIRLLYAAGKGSDHLAIELDKRYVFGISNGFNNSSIWLDIIRYQHSAMVPSAILLLTRLK